MTTVTFGQPVDLSNPDFDGVKMVFPSEISSPKNTSRHRIFISISGSSLVPLGYAEGSPELAKFLLFEHVVPEVRDRLANDTLEERIDLPTVIVNSSGEVNFNPTDYHEPENTSFEVGLNELQRQRESDDK